MLKKTFIAIIISFILTTILTKTVFYAGTPRINRVFITSIINLPLKLFQSTNNFIASLKTNNTANQVNNQPLNKNTATNNTNQKSLVQSIELIPLSAMTQVSNGVYAKEDKTNNIYYFKFTKNAEWEEKEYIVNGKKVIIDFPKGTIK
jgi:hypothetical protein